MTKSRRTILLTSVIGVVTVVILYRIIIYIVAVFVAGHVMGYRVCDYQPIDTKGQPLAQWSEMVERVRFSMHPLSLSISGNAHICLEIRNDSDKEVVVVGGQVVTYGRTIEAKVLDGPVELLLRTVPPRQSKEVCLYWEFGTWLDQVLGQDITWVWKVKIGAAEHSLQVPMQRKDVAGNE